MWAYALGVRRHRQTQTLDVYYPTIHTEEKPTKRTEVFFKVSGLTPGETGLAILDELQLQKILEQIAPDFGPFQEDIDLIETYLNFEPEKTDYFQSDVVLYNFFAEPHDEKSQNIKSIEEAYFRLQLLSQRKVKPNEIHLRGLFGILPNLAWTNRGPRLLADVPKERLKSHYTENPLQITHVDKFPYLLDYHIPSGVRIADGARVRLGAYLGEGSTVMPAGYVNFNAGAAGPSMIEGRVSAGVFVEEGSDIGGGASIMGTLSGGNDLQVAIGPGCLLGANAGVGISLGKGCTIAAGLYIYAGMKVSLVDLKEEPIDLTGKPVEKGQNVFKAKELSGRDHLLFIQNSQTGEVICKPNLKSIELNEELHKN